MGDPRRCPTVNDVSGPRAVDADPSRRNGPLAGVPVAVKDNVDVAGLPTRHGSAATPDRPAAADDELVRRLRAAGSVVLGKTRMPELAIWPSPKPPPSEGPANPGRRNPPPAGRMAAAAAASARGMARLRP